MQIAPGADWGALCTRWQPQNSHVPHAALSAGALWPVLSTNAPAFAAGVVLSFAALTVMRLFGGVLSALKRQIAALLAGIWHHILAVARSRAEESLKQQLSTKQAEAMQAQAVRCPSFLDHLSQL
jgi:hypothetical protein